MGSVFNPTKYHYRRTLGNKEFELNDHLGNVMLTISDRKIANQVNGVVSYTADIKTAQDYYPFGMLMPERNSNSDKYRFGFNGKENDNEVKGTGNSLDFGARIYDSRLGRFLSVDPLNIKFPSESNYIFAGNSPILFIDLQGKIKLEYTKDQQEELGLTDLQMQKFTNILKNLKSLVEKNEDAMLALMKTTGLNRDDILKDLTYGKEGPSISLIKGGGATAYDESFTFGADMIKNLTNEKIDMDIQAFGVGMTLIDEYAHVGDKRTNDGKSTGQYFFPKKGKQDWHTSPTKHRGGDPALFGWGVKTSSKVEESGIIDVEKASYKEIITKEGAPGCNRIPENTDVKSLGKELLK